MVDMYNKLVNKIEDLNPSDINEAVYHLDWMFNCTLSSNQSHTLTQTFMILLGYQYLGLYKLCSPSTKQIIQGKLAQIIQALSSYYIPSNALNVIILKNGYRSIVSDDIS
ncbi:hypothetical protein CONCODRAFT_12656 [Conidiobolus coronatus NRRL 28638]|uniref:Uncharacterized protein n=1 Tax=Conidiobolus coronatus (strain ATCC 28846 / CBS 209.66 / NRRL 28638) TaxID=796925 RepID=A0A137NSD7_CONC2|nr:hypothetical protein CONCODRAFT_12656 [Conidiobolus coronatus NRRL 28638]|eukprot:KXN65679.1 hypothetical protein CONCODRAFT_12656 [Conidiobolus coronatus NRRL 28638]